MKMSGTLPDLTLFFFVFRGGDFLPLVLHLVRSQVAPKRPLSFTMKVSSTQYLVASAPKEA